MENKKTETSTVRVVKNSMWLIVQPLLMNVIAVSVTGYIARTLGVADYGKLRFTIAFVTMFLPIANFGLRAVAVRSMAQNNERAPDIFGEIISLRFFLSLLTLVVVYVSALFIHDDPVILTAVLIYGSTVLFRTMDTSFQDGFQAAEKMKYIAISQMVTGVGVTTLSLLVLLIGMRFFGVVAAYTLGPILGVLYSYFTFRKNLFVPVFKINFKAWLGYIKKGLPFFIPAIIGAVGWKMGIIFLSKMKGDASVGIFGAASDLVERLVIIPDAVGGAIFPAIAAAWVANRGEARHVFRRFFQYLLIIGLPITVGTVILARPIIHLIYGAEFTASALVLQILICKLALVFMNAIQGWTLSAIHLEKKQAVISLVTMVLFIAFNYLLIRPYGEIGAAIAALLASVISFIWSHTLIHRNFTQKVITVSLSMKIFSANLIMGVFVYALAISKHFWGDEWVLKTALGESTTQIPLELAKLLSCIFLGMSVYAVAVLILGLISKSEIRQGLQVFLSPKRNTTP